MFLGLLLACSKRKEEGHTEMKREDIANMLLSLMWETQLEISSEKNIS